MQLRLGFYAFRDEGAARHRPARAAAGQHAFQCRAVSDDVPNLLVGRGGSASARRGYNVVAGHVMADVLQVEELARAI
ncbi:hypothetical protein IHE33_13850 (plasmid) [Mycetohabitans endofungorum]|uniref:hypothetical protein n=1 Tax=Mycetohabitans endofungorum TaxID=417203 RepID=UPI0030D1DB4D